MHFMKGKKKQHINTQSNYIIFETKGTTRDHLTISHTLGTSSHRETQKEAPSWSKYKRSASNPACRCSSWPLGFTLGLHMVPSPSPLSTFLPPAWWGSSHRSNHMLFICSACFCPVPTTKRSLSLFTLPLAFLPPSSPSIRGVKRRKGMRIQFKEQGQPSPLMIHGTSRQTEEPRSEGGGGGEGGRRSAWWLQLQKATSIWQQTAQGRSVLLLHAGTGHHGTYYTERER